MQLTGGTTSRPSLCACFLTRVEVEALCSASTIMSSALLDEQQHIFTFGLFLATQIATTYVRVNVTLVLPNMNDDSEEERGAW